MELILLILGGIIGIPLGLLFFALLNECFDVYYFGFKGMWATLLSCIATAVAICMFVIGLIGVLAVPIGIVLIIWGNKKRKKNQQNNDENDNENE